MATQRRSGGSAAPLIEPPPDRPTRRPVRFLDSLDVELTPDRIEIPVDPAPIGFGKGLRSSIWHAVRQTHSFKVAITSSDSRHRILRLSAESEDRAFRPRWARWNFAARRAPELLGGDALDAQDIVVADGDRLQLLIAAGETREAFLDFEPVLDGETLTGDYQFDVVVEDVTDAEQEVPAATVAGILRLTHPPSSLLHDLPSIYVEEVHLNGGAQQGYQEPEFFERYLLGFEDVTKVLQQTLSHLDRLFGPYSAPSSYLLWLAAWVCMPLDENWPEMRRRRLVREAVELFRWRGTRRGLARFLEIYTGVVPEINDRPFVGMRLGPEAMLGTDSTILGDVPPHTFVVTLAVPNPDELDERVVHEIIRYEKPAHTAYTLNIARRASSAD